MAIYPVGLLIMMTGTLYVLNTELIPVLSKISSPDSWSGALGFLYGLSLFVDNYGAICAVLFCSGHRCNIMVSEKLEKPLFG